MNSKAGGWIVAVVGIILLVYGFQSADSISSEFSKFFTGSPTNKTIWLLVAGAVCSIYGLMLLGRRTRE